MGLVEFLNGRLDEDEQAAREAADPPPPAPVDRYVLVATWGGGSTSWIGRDWPWNPERALAEVAAKRAIVERFAWLRDNGWSGEPELPVLEEVARALAQPYSDHSDFDPAWKLI